MGTIVVSGGQVAGIQITPAALRETVQLSQDFTQDYAKIYREHRAVQTVVSAIARQIAQLGLHVYERVDDNDRRRLTDHPAARLFKRPDRGTTYFEFMYALVADLAIFDRYYAVRVGDKDGDRLVRLPPREVEHVGDAWHAPAAFKVGGVEVAADKVLFIRGYSPNASQFGVSPLESLRRALAEDWQAGLTREQLFRNGARISGYIERPVQPRGETWSHEARQRFKRAWQDQFTSSGTRPGGTPVLEDGMTFKPASMSAVDLQYIEARKLTREEVAAAYHIPAPMVGILDNATFSNIREQHQMLYQDTLGPWLQRIQQALELGLGEWLGLGDAYLEFNVQEKMRGAFEDQAAMLQQAAGAPYMTRNEVRSRLNLPQVAGGDELVTPLNVLAGDPGGAPSPFKARPLRAKARRVRAKITDSSHGEPVETLADDLTAFFGKQRRHVRSAGKSLPPILAKASQPAWWDGERWDGELADILERRTLEATKKAGAAALADLDLDPAEYDVDRTTAYLRKVAESNASSINAATRIQIEEALDEDEDFTSAVDAVFDDAEERRSSQIGQTVLTAAAAWAVHEAATQVAGERSVWKEWVVTSGNPRPEHAAMNGERVPLDDTFSNGARWPGDSAALDVDDIAGCSCEVQIGWDD